MINVIMSTWYTIKNMLSHEHNIEHNKRVLQHSIIGKIKPNSLVPIIPCTYADLVIKIIKLYINCGIIVVLIYWHNIEHNR